MNNYLDTNCYFCRNPIISSRAACAVHLKELEEEFIKLKREKFEEDTKDSEVDGGD